MALAQTQARFQSAAAQVSVNFTPHSELWEAILMVTYELHNHHFDLGPSVPENHTSYYYF